MPCSAAGRGGEAFGLSLTGSVLGGLFSAVVLAVFAPLLAKLAAEFGPREYLAVCVLVFPSSCGLLGPACGRG